METLFQQLVSVGRNSLEQEANRQVENLKAQARGQFKAGVFLSLAGLGTAYYALSRMSGSRKATHALLASCVTVSAIGAVASLVGIKATS